MVHNSFKRSMSVRARVVVDRHEELIGASGAGGLNLTAQRVNEFEMDDRKERRRRRTVNRWIVFFVARSAGSG